MSADLDVALITQPERNAKLTMTKLAETPLHIVLPREHNLASKSAIKLADLRDERWIIYQQRTHPLLYESIMKLMRDDNIHPKHIDRIFYPGEAEPGVSPPGEPRTAVPRHLLTSSRWRQGFSIPSSDCC